MNNKKEPEPFEIRGDKIWIPDELMWRVFYRDQQGNLYLKSNKPPNQLYLKPNKPTTECFL